MSKKKIIFPVCLLVIIAGVFFINRKVSASNQVEFLFKYQYDYWDTYDFSKGPYPTKADYEKAVTSYMQGMEELLNMKDWKMRYASKGVKQIYLNLNVNSSARGGAMSNPADYGEHAIMFTMCIGPQIMTGEENYDPVCHELVHMITYNPDLVEHAFNMELNDGLCEYVSYALTGKAAYKDPHLSTIKCLDWVLEEKKINQEDIESIKENLCKNSKQYQYIPFSNEWSVAFLLGDSFSRYIIDTYGLDYFLELHNPVEDENVLKQHEEKLHTLKDEWVQFIDNYKATTT